MRILFSLLSLLLVATGAVCAQEETAVDTTAITNSPWYTSPWVWVIGAALVLLVLLLVTRGGSRSSE